MCAFLSAGELAPWSPLALESCLGDSCGSSFSHSSAKETVSSVDDSLEKRQISAQLGGSSPRVGDVIKLVVACGRRQ